MIRVLFISHMGSWTGADSCLFHLVSGLPRERFMPIVALPNDGWLRSRLEAAQVPFRWAPVLEWTGKGLPAIAAEVRGRLRAHVDIISNLITVEQPDVVVSNSAVLLSGAFAARRCGVPHVWRIHEMLGRHGEFDRAFDLPVFARIAAELSDANVAVSHSVRDDLAPWLDLEVIYNGVDVPLQPRLLPRARRALFGIEEEAPVLLFVGSLSAAKGVLLMPDVLDDVRRLFPKARCVMVGDDGGARDALMERIAQLGLEDAFHFLGARSDVAAIMSAGDILILPSWIDSLPCVVMEAMAMGLPVVATRSGGAAEMIVDGTSGRLVDAGDAAALARAVTSLLSSPEEMRRTGEAAQARMRESFQRAAYIEQFARLFERLSERKAQPPRARAAELLDEILGEAR
jgi:glycosyltransferase involved in cell wall biosynthesis